MELISKQQFINFFCKCRVYKVYFRGMKMFSCQALSNFSSTNQKNFLGNMNTSLLIWHWFYHDQKILSIFCCLLGSTVSSLLSQISPFSLLSRLSHCSFSTLSFLSIFLSSPSDPGGWCIKIRLIDFLLSASIF